MRISKHVLKSLPKVVGKDAEMQQMEYVHSVLGGDSKAEALKLHFPDIYDLAMERSVNNPKTREGHIKTAIAVLERKNTVKQMYALAHKHAWTNFLVKKVKLLDNLYDMAMDDNNSVKERTSSSNTWLSHMPKFEEDKTIVVELKDGKKNFVDRLHAMKLSLHRTANEELDENVIDVDIEKEK